MQKHTTTERTWIKIKRGLITDPKHREKMGSAIWLFHYMLDIADWKTGKVNGWKDRLVADDMDYSVHTVRKHRQILESENYITCEQKQHSLIVTILNYTNPREHAERLLNPKAEPSDDPPHMGGVENPEGDTDVQPSAQGDTDVQPSTVQGDTDIQPSTVQGDMDVSPSSEGDTKGDTDVQPSTRAPLKESLTTTQKPQDSTTTSSSRTRDSDSKVQKIPDDDFAAMFQEWERSGGPLTPAIADDLKDLALECERHRSQLPKGSLDGRINGAAWVTKSIKVARQATNASFSVRYIQAILDRWRTDGMDRPQDKKTVTSAKEHDEWMKERQQKAREKIRQASQNS